MKRVAISVGDLNGIGIEIVLRSHDNIKQICEPIYCINKSMLNQAASLLNLKVPNNIILESIDGDFKIESGFINAQSGKYSYDSFIKAVELVRSGMAEAVVTLPIHKKAWSLANIPYRGHTEALRSIFNSDATMVLGNNKLYVPLFTEHIPLKEVHKKINKRELLRFFETIASAFSTKRVGVLGVNPHAGDGGVIGDEDRVIKEAVDEFNKSDNQLLLSGPLVPDTAFTPHSLENFDIIAAMYHDQGLAPLKALYFEESINISLGLPVVRTSVDHGTAFDIAYSNSKISLTSYENAVKAALKLKVQK